MFEVVVRDFRPKLLNVPVAISGPRLNSILLHNFITELKDIIFAGLFS